MLKFLRIFTLKVVWFLILGDNQEVQVKKEKSSEEPVDAIDGIDEEQELLSLRDTVRDEMTALQKENKRLHKIVTDLHKSHHEHSLKVNYTHKK